MRNEQNISPTDEEGGEVGEPAGTSLAAMVPEDRGKRPIASWFIDKPVKNEVAAGKCNFNGVRRLFELRRDRRHAQQEEEYDCDECVFHFASHRFRISRGRLCR